MFDSVGDMDLPSSSVHIQKLVYGGNALGRLPDGRAVFIPYALPGEKVQVRIVEEKRGHLRGELVEVEEASPQRIAPRCSHFMQCGGCHYQHISYKHQQAAKEDILRDQLARIGKLEAANILPMVPAPSPWAYRNQLQFHLTSDGKLGFQAARSHTIIPVSECHLPEQPISDMWPRLEFEARCGIDRLGLRLGRDDELLLVLEAETSEMPELEIEAGISVVHMLGEECLVMAGDDHIVMEVMERPFQVSAGSFFQVHTAMAEKMVEHILSELDVSPSTRFMDVYCGVGLFSAFLAGRVRQVVGIESSASACEDFAVNLDQFDNVELYRGAAEMVLPYLDAKPDIILVDPPRAGLDRRVLDAILEKSPKTLVYVSCDPSTLGRDALRLGAGGYRLCQVTPFDLFPQTYHIESVSIFERVA